ncbi:MAG: hypothetical protein ACKVVP_05025, partial [Chloroflexota bacterium]
MRSQYTRSGTRRAGDDYQDIVALDLLVELLEHPSRYEYVEVEADDAGALDDVVAHRPDGSVLARQVKFSTNPTNDGDEWTWDKFLTRAQGARGALNRSLIQKWAGAFLELQQQGARVDAELVS